VVLFRLAVKTAKPAFSATVTLPMESVGAASSLLIVPTAVTLPMARL
jgi:hypothetical protein